MQFILNQLPLPEDMLKEISKYLECGICHQTKFTQTKFSSQGHCLPLIKYEPYHVLYPTVYKPVECCIDCFNTYIDKRIDNIINNISPLHCKKIGDTIEFIDFCLSNVSKRKIHNSLTRISQKHADVYRMIYKL